MTTEHKVFMGIGMFSLVILIGSVWFFSAPGTKEQKQMNNLTFTGSDNEIVSQQGIHWHPKLAIYIKGKKQEIPNNVGIGIQHGNSKFYDSMMSMADIHTHDSTGVLHWEVMQGPVRKGYLRLGNLFEIWGKNFSSTALFDKKNAPEGKVKMTVNGKNNTEFENYKIHDGDNIEIRYD
jgi:hypothetical protein